MKKTAFVLFLSLISILSFISCSKTGDCMGFCGKKDVKLKTFKNEYAALDLCEECYSLLQQIEEDAKNY